MHLNYFFYKAIRPDGANETGLINVDSKSWLKANNFMSAGPIGARGFVAIILL